MRQPITASKAHLNPERVAFYMEQLDETASVTVFDTGTELILADGHHRIEAAQRLGRTTIEADLRSGTRHEALQFAIQHAKEQRGLTDDEVVAAIRRQAGWRWGHSVG